MAQGAPLELDAGSIEGSGHQPGSSTLVDRLIELSSWMMVLGTIRFLCTLTDSTGAFIDAWRISPTTTLIVSWWLSDNRLILVLCAAWPLVISVALRHTRWRELLPAAAATFLVLSIGGLAAATLEWTDAQGAGGTIGSFHLTHRAFLNPRLSDVFLGVIGVAQLSFELVVAVLAIRLIFGFRAAAVPAKRGRARPARYGRLAIYASLGFLALMISFPAGLIYHEILKKSAFVRDFILRNDPGTSNRSKVGLTPDEKWVRHTQALATAASAEMNERQFLAAQESYLHVIARIDTLYEGPVLDTSRPTLALALNNLAWLQATCPDTRVLNFGNAVQHARRAVELRPDEGNYWNTLGVAYYRSGDWNEAKNALFRSMELRNEGDAFDWFFLALVERKLGHQDQARQWYDKAVDWYRETRPKDQELYRFHVEAAQELGLPKPSPPASISKAPIPITTPPPTIRSRMRPSTGDDTVKRRLP